MGIRLPVLTHRAERELSERLYAEALPFLRSIRVPRSSIDPVEFVRTELDSGEWAAAVGSLLQLGYRPDDATREEIRRLWVHGDSADARSIERALTL